MSVSVCSLENAYFNHLKLNKAHRYIYATTQNNGSNQLYIRIQGEVIGK